MDGLFIMEKHTIMDGLGVPPLMEPSIYDGWIIMDLFPSVKCWIDKY